MTDGELPVRRIGTVVIAAMPEEIDLANVAALAERLAAVVLEGPTALVVDMSATRYCDSAGVATLVRTSKAAAAAGVQVRVAASRPVLRIMRLLGADQVIDTHPSLAAALGGESDPHPPGTRGEPGSRGGSRRRTAGDPPPASGSPQAGV